jgi:DNA-binding transcriptional regulator YiaG
MAEQAAQEPNPAAVLYSKLLHLLSLTKSLAFKPYVEATRYHLEQQSGLTRHVAAQLTQTALRRYGTQLCAQTDGTEAVSLSFSGRIVSFGPSLEDVQFQNDYDQTQVIQSVQTWVSQIFVDNGLWNKISAEVWASLLVWTVQDLELSTAISVIASLAQEPFQVALWLKCFSPDAPDLQPVYQETLSYWIAQLSAQIARAIALDQMSSTAIEQFVGLMPSDEAIGLKVPALNLPQIPDAPPWIALLGIPAASEPRLPPTAGLEQMPADEQHPRNGLPSSGYESIYLEHYLTRPQDLAVLPWELLTQLKRNYGLAVVQLQFLWAAHAMMQRHPASSTVTLKVSDIRAQLDWSLAAEQAPDPLELATQLSEMKITTIWMTDPRSAQVEAFRLSGAPWEVFSNVQGNLDWTTGLLSKPEQTYITIRPGLWTSHLMAIGGPPIERAFRTFGELALSLLRLNYCGEPLLLSLLVFLMFREVLLSQAEERPVDSVRDLLREALPYTAEVDWTLQPEHAFQLMKVWHQSLGALATMGWRPTEHTIGLPQDKSFYLHCPDWLLHTEPKPQDWVEQWLALPVQFRPPLGALKEPSVRLSQLSDPAPLESSKYSTRLRFDRLTGAEIRTARKALHLTQSQLADALNVHQSLIAKIEAGRRSVSDELERPLRQVLAL